jgi:hypothetical protein
MADRAAWGSAAAPLAAAILNTQAKGRRTMNGGARWATPLVAALCIMLFSTRPASGRLTITGGAPATGSILPAGATATLSCTTSAPWFLCIWEGPGGVACQCQTSPGGGVNSMCQGNPR